MFPSHNALCTKASYTSFITYHPAAISMGILWATMAQDMDLSWICCLQTVGSSAAFIYLFSTSSMLLVPYSQLFVLSPPSAVKKESLSSMDKEGVDSSESGESLVIG